VFEFGSSIGSKAANLEYMSPILSFIIQSFIKHFHDLDEVIPVNNGASVLLASHD
jgi:hypothetical protein